MKEYLFNTLISFISLNAVFYITKNGWSKFITKKNNILKVQFDRLIFCLIPIFRWIFIALILFMGILICNEKIANEVKQKMDDEQEKK